MIHCAGGSVVLNADGGLHALGAVQLPADFSCGATGAGDAFAAGYLWGLHEQLPADERLRLATAAAAQSLSHPAPSAGLLTLADCLRLAEQHGHRPW